MGDAGRGSFEDAQDKAGTDAEARPAAPAAAAVDADDWHAKLHDQLGGAGGPREERTNAAGPGRGRS
jgi:hypothetical protein